MEGTNDIDGETVAQFIDTGKLTPCATNDYSADINWGDKSDHSSGTITCSVQTVEDQDVAVYTVTGSHTYFDSGDFSIIVTVTEPDATQTSNSDDPDTATIGDADITATSGTTLGGGGEGATTEGGTVGASAFFADGNTAFADANGSVDPGLKAIIDWGDGTTSAATSIVAIDCECGNLEVGGTHVYDANIPVTKTYSVTIKLTDDGGKSATSAAGTTPAFSDGSLTAGSAKSFTATATKATTQVVASFHDAAGAQAKPSDFAATIKWGDNTSSPGTISMTATGTFSVTGSHTYATAGTKTLTITVTDEEGATVSMAATATVAAVPIVLPLTGRPQPATPVAPIYLALLMLGIAFVGGGLIGAKVRKA